MKVVPMSTKESPVAGEKLVVAITSSALFDMKQSNEIYEQEGLEAYRQYQVDREDQVLDEGDAFPFVRKLLHINQLLEGDDRVEVFFDLLCPELNLDGVVYFYQNMFAPIVKAIQKHFAPAEQILQQVSCLSQLDGPVESVLRKTYQSNWRQIMRVALPESACRAIANNI